MERQKWAKSPNPQIPLTGAKIEYLPSCRTSNIYVISHILYCKGLRDHVSDEINSNVPVWQLFLRPGWDWHPGYLLLQKLISFLSEGAFLHTTVYFALNIGYTFRKTLLKRKKNAPACLFHSCSEMFFIRFQLGTSPEQELDKSLVFPLLVSQFKLSGKLLGMCFWSHISSSRKRNWKKKCRKSRMATFYISDPICLESWMNGSTM